MTILRKIVGTNKHYGKDCEIGLGMTLFNSESCFLPFMPVIVPASELKKEKTSFGMHCVNLFPTSKIGPHKMQSLNSDHVIKIDPLQVLENRKFLEVERFDYNRLERIAAYVKASGAVTFVIPEAKVARDMLSNIGKIKDRYKHSSVMYRNTGSSTPNRSTEKIVTYLSVYDLPFTVPIFNKRRAEGLGFHLVFVWDHSTENNSTLCHAGEFFFAVNQYRENLLVVDGQVTNKEAFLGDDYIGHYCSFLANETKRQAEIRRMESKAKKSSSRGEKKPSEASPRLKQKYMKLDNETQYYYAAGTTTSSTSTW